MEITIDRSPERTPLRIPDIESDNRSNEKSVAPKSALFFNGTQFQGGPRRRSPQKVIFFMWTAAIIDWLIILAMSLIAVVILSQVGTSEVMQTMKWLFAKSASEKSFLGLLIICGWVYFIVVRTYLGATIGEWTCDLRLGKPSERMQKRYVLRNFARTSIVIVSGLFVIPVLSLIFKKDLAGSFSGLYIYSLK